MKKAYIKPCVQLEYFTLSQSIAKTCGYNDESFWGKPTHSDIVGTNPCGWQEIDGTIIWTSKGVCSDNYPEDVDVSEGCYNAPTATNAIFAS